MRISSLQAFNLGVKGIQQNYSEMIRTQQQISTGNRILTPADDPVASVRLMQLEQQQNMLGQYKENLIAANNSLVQEESTLNSVNTIMQRIRVLAEEAGNGALSQSDRQSIAAELREREDELLGLMNTKNARGEYLFAGFQGKTQPFVRQGDGSFQYLGDEGQRKLQVASSLEIAISDNGKKVFENVTNASRLNGSATYFDLGAGQTLVVDSSKFSGMAYGAEIFDDPLNPGDYYLVPLDDNGLRDMANAIGPAVLNGTELTFDGLVVQDFNAASLPIALGAGQFQSTLQASPPLIQDEIAFAGSPNYPNGEFQIEFKSLPDNPKEYTITEIGSGQVLGSGVLDDRDEVHDSLVFAGIVVHIDGVPSGGETIRIGQPSAVPGPDGSTASREKQGVLDTIYQLRKALEENPDSPEGNRATRDAVAAAITNIDHAMVTIDRTRGDIGARMNIIETTLTDNENVTLVNQEVQAELREVDYPEALSKLAFQSIILEAAQQSYVKTSQLSLFNRM